MARRRLEINASKKQKKVSPESWEAAQYFFVWTTLGRSFAALPVLELYRLRWQIELAFKRMKSIMGLGHLPKKDPASARVATRQDLRQSISGAHGRNRRYVFPLGMRQTVLVMPS